MGVIDRIRGTIGKAAVEVATRTLGLELTTAWERKQWISPTYRNLVSEGFKANGVAFACVSTLLNSYTEPPLVVSEVTKTGLVDLPDHDLQTLLDNPNPDMSGLELRQMILLYKAISGSCYIWKRRTSPRTGRVVEIWPLSDGLVRPIASGNRLVDYFEFDNGSGPIRLDVEDVVHLKWMPDPMRPWMGYGPLMAILREILTDNEATAYQYAVLANDAVPRLQLVVSPERKTDLSEDEKTQLREAYLKGHGGTKRGGIAVTTGGVKLEPIALNMRDLEFDHLRRVPEARICAAFGVPANIAGMVVGLDTMTYDNVKGLAIQFTERKMVPMWRADGEELTQGLASEFQNGRRRLTIRFDTSKVVALQERLIATRQWALSAVAAGALKVMHFQAMSGLEVDPTANYYLRGPMVEQIYSSRGPAPEPKGLTAPIGGLVRGREVKAEAKAGAQRVAKVLRKIRLQAIAGMEPEVAAHFEKLAGAVVARARKMGKAKDKASDLLTAADAAALAAILKKWTLEILKGSWDVMNAGLGTETPFSLTDPVVLRILAQGGTKIKAIDAETLQAVRDYLELAAERGWGVEKMIAGDPDEGIPGLRSIVEQTYRGRAENISRTEMGTAQNEASLLRYKDNGASLVVVLDGDGPNSCDECLQYASGDVVWTIEEARANPLEHPQCIRAFGPVMETGEEV